MYIQLILDYTMKIARERNYCYIDLLNYLKNQQFSTTFFSVSNTFI